MLQPELTALFAAFRSEREAAARKRGRADGLAELLPAMKTLSGLSEVHHLSHTGGTDAPERTDAERGDPEDWNELLQLAMVAVAEAFQARGEDPRPVLDQLAELADDPDALMDILDDHHISLGWVAAQTKRGTVKAVGTEEQEGKVLYGQPAQRALRSHERGSRGKSEGVVNEARRVLAEGGHLTAEHAAVLADHLPDLSGKELRDLRNTLLERMKRRGRGTAKNRAGFIANIQTHVGKLVKAAVDAAEHAASQPETPAPAEPARNVAREEEPGAVMEATEQESEPSAAADGEKPGSGKPVLGPDERSKGWQSVGEFDTREEAEAADGEAVTAAGGKWHAMSRKADEPAPAPQPAARAIPPESLVKHHLEELLRERHHGSGSVPAGEIQAAVGDGVDATKVLNDLRRSGQVRMVEDDKGGYVVETTDQFRKVADADRPPSQHPAPPPPDELKAAVSGMVSAALAGGRHEGGMVPIHQIRAEIKAKFGDGAASHKVLDEVLHDMRRSGEAGLIPIDNRSRATEDQLRDSITAPVGSLYYLEPGKNFKPQEPAKADEKPAEEAAPEQVEAPGDAPVDRDAELANLIAEQQAELDGEKPKKKKGKLPKVPYKEQPQPVAESSVPAGEVPAPAEQSVSEKPGVSGAGKQAVPGKRPAPPVKSEAELEREQRSQIDAQQEVEKQAKKAGEPADDFTPPPSDKPITRLADVPDPQMPDGDDAGRDKFAESLLLMGKPGETAEGRLKLAASAPTGKRKSMAQDAGMTLEAFDAEVKRRMSGEEPAKAEVKPAADAVQEGAAVKQPHESAVDALMAGRSFAEWQDATLKRAYDDDGKVADPEAVKALEAADLSQYVRNREIAGKSVTADSGRKVGVVTGFTPDMRYAIVRHDDGTESTLYADGLNSLSGHVKQELAKGKYGKTDSPAMSHFAKKVAKEAVDSGRNISDVMREMGIEPSKANPIRGRIAEEVDRLKNAAKPEPSPELSRAREKAKASQQAEPAPVQEGDGDPGEYQRVGFPSNRKKKPTKAATGESLAAVVKSLGGIDPNSDALKAHFSNMTDAVQNGLSVGMFTKGGRGLDQLAQELHTAGHIHVPDGEDPVQHLVDKLRARAASLHHDATGKYDKALADYERQQAETSDQQGLKYEYNPDATLDDLFADPGTDDPEAAGAVRAAAAAVQGEKEKGAGGETDGGDAEAGGEGWVAPWEENADEPAPAEKPVDEPTPPSPHAADLKGMHPGEAKFVGGYHVTRNGDGTYAVQTGKKTFHGGTAADVAQHIAAGWDRQKWQQKSIDSALKRAEDHPPLNPFDPASLARLDAESKKAQQIPTGVAGVSTDGPTRGRVGVVRAGEDGQKKLFFDDSPDEFATAAFEPLDEKHSFRVADLTPKAKAAAKTADLFAGGPDTTGPTPDIKAKGPDTDGPKVEYVRAKAGGERSPVNGEFYPGGRLMPIHGKYAGMEKPPKGAGVGTGDGGPAKPNEDAEGVGSKRQPARALSPDELAERQVENERQKKWDEMKTGPLSQIAGFLGDRPNSKAGGVAYDKWREYVKKIGPDGVRKIVAALEPQFHAAVEGQIKPQIGVPSHTGRTLTEEDMDYFKGEAKQQAEQDVEMFGAKAKKLERDVPGSHYARQLIQSMMHEGQHPKGTHVADRLHAVNGMITAALGQQTSAPLPDGQSAGESGSTPPAKLTAGSDLKKQLLALKRSATDPKAKEAFDIAAGNMTAKHGHPDHEKQAGRRLVQVANDMRRLGHTGAADAAEHALSGIADKMHEAGTTHPFDPLHHEADGPVRTGATVTVTQPGWAMRDDKGEYILSKTKVKAGSATPK